jgi:hypothetical protein
VLILVLTLVLVAASASAVPIVLGLHKSGAYLLGLHKCGGAYVLLCKMLQSAVLLQSQLDGQLQVFYALKVPVHVATALGSCCAYPSVTIRVSSSIK